LNACSAPRCLAECCPPKAKVVCSNHAGRANKINDLRQIGVKRAKARLTINSPTKSKRWCVIGGQLAGSTRKLRKRNWGFKTEERYQQYHHGGFRRKWPTCSTWPEILTRYTDGNLPPAHAALDHYRWRLHCRGPFQTPIAAYLRIRHGQGDRKMLASPNFDADDPDRKCTSL